MSDHGDLTVIGGNAHPELTAAICAYGDVPVGRARVSAFSNECIFAKIEESVRGHDVFVVQPFASPLSESIMELLILLDTLRRASAGRTTVVVPYFAYGRTDKKDQSRVPITARLLADLITTAGAHRVLTLDLHAGQIQGFFNIPVDELTAMPLLAQHFLARRATATLPLVVVSPDLGNTKRARNFAELLDAPLAIVEKRRSTDGLRTETLNLIGDVAGCTAILIDDEIDTAGSITQAAELVLRRGAREVSVAATHAVLSGPAIERLAASPIVEVVVTDSLPLPAHKRLPKIHVVSTAALFAETIGRIHTDTSVSLARQALGVRQVSFSS